MDSAQVGVLEETDEVSLGSLLQGHDSGGLEAEISLEVLGDLTDQALEGQLADQQLGALLVPTDLTESHCSWPVSVGLLHTSGGWGALTGSLGSQLFARSLSSSRFTGSLLGTGHFEAFKMNARQGTVLSLYRGSARSLDRISQSEASVGQRWCLQAVFGVIFAQNF